MFDHEETIHAVHNFYRVLVSLAYPDESLLKEPPAGGWDNLNMDALQKWGKNDTVITLLRHLPYLESSRRGNRLLIHYETIARDYTADLAWHDEVWPLPSHCVYLTESVDSMGYSLIVDTERGTITEFSGQGSHVTIPYEEEEALPPSEKWRAHRTTPVVEFFTKWEIRYDCLVWMLVPAPSSGPTTGRFYSRVFSEADEDEVIGQGFTEWTPENLKSHRYWRDRPEERDHIQRLYETFLRNGWPGNFDKVKCRAELLMLERRKAGMSDDDVATAKVRKATGGIPPRRRPVQ